MVGGVPYECDGQVWAKSGFSVSSFSAMRPTGRVYCVPTNQTSSDFSSTGRAVDTMQGNATLMQLQFDAGSDVAGTVGNESQQLSPQIIRAWLEYPLGTTPRPFSVGGQTEWVLKPGAAPVLTDILGAYIPDGAQYATRVFQRVAKKPQGTPTATAVAGGSLTSGQQLFFKITTLDNGCESNASTEVSVTPSGSNLSVALAWTPDTYQSGANIYVGTTSGANTYLMTVQGSAGGVVISSLVGQTSAAAPTTQPTLVGRRLHYSNLDMSTTQNSGSGNGSNQGANASWAASAGTNVGPSTVFMPAPSLVLANTDKDLSWGGMGDSIQMGAGCLASSGLGVNFSNQLASWFVSAMQARNLTWFNHSIGGAILANLVANGGATAGRLSKWLRPKRLISNMATNDLSAGQTWQQVAANHLALAAIRYNAGRLTYLATNLPRVTTTNGCTTIAGQTATGSNAARINYNTWLRNGCQVDGAGAPVLTGGTPSPYITGVFDAAALVEVDASNVLALNGGYWQAPTAPVYTGAFTGTPTTSAQTVGTSSPTIPTQSATENVIIAHVLKITSGAAAGQLALIKSCTGGVNMTTYALNDTTYSGTTVAYGLATAPASGDTFEVWRTLCAEGLHPANAGHAQISAGFQAWLASIGS